MSLLINVIRLKTCAQNCAKKRETLPARGMSLFISWVLPLVMPLLSVGVNHSLFTDAGSLTSELAQIVELSATNLTYLVHLDRIDVG